MSHLLYPSLLSANFENLANVCKLLNKSDADGFHLDVMDGVFVPNISFGFPVIEAIRHLTSKPMDVHLMIVHPEPYIERFKEAGANTLTVHFETCSNPQTTIAAIKKSGMKACMALNPQTPVSSLSAVIKDLDSVCVMSVNPGFGGQKFIEATYAKLKQLKEMILLSNSDALIKVDGGIDLQNYQKVVSAGAQVLVAGSAVFDAENPSESIHALKYNTPR